MVLNYAEMLHLAEQKEEFRVKREIVDGVEVDIFTYMVAMKDTFDSELAKEFRGTVFRADTGECICRPLPKFFNIGEREETLRDNIDLNGAVYYTKFDGSMLTPVLINDQIFWKTKKSFYSDVALKAQNFYDNVLNGDLFSDCNLNYSRDILKLMCKRYTPIFEYVAPHNRIVLEYSEENLQILGNRNIWSGTYIPTESIAKNVEYSEIAEMKDIEGFVIQLRNGELVKAKTSEYCDIHRIVTCWTPKQVIKSTLEETIDDMIAVVAELNLPETKEQIEVIRDEVLREKLFVMGLIESKWEKCKLHVHSRKELALFINRFIAEKYRRFMFLIADGKDITEVLNGYLYELVYDRYKPQGV